MQTDSHLSEFGSGFFLFHSAMGNEVIKHLSYIRMSKGQEENSQGDDKSLI